MKKVLIFLLVVLCSFPLYGQDVVLPFLIVLDWIKADSINIRSMTVTSAVELEGSVAGKLVVDDSLRVEETSRFKGASTFGLTATPVTIASTGKVTASDTIVSSKGIRSEGAARVKGIATFGATATTATISTAGKVTAPSLQITTSPTAGHVLTSDASGNATWVVPGAASVNPAVQRAVSGSMGGLFFDGTDDVLTITDHANLDPGVDDFSIEIIGFQPSSVTDGNSYNTRNVVLYQHCDASDTVLVTQYDNTIRISLSDGATTISKQSLGGSLTTRDAQHIFITFDRDGVATLYVNGVASATTVNISSVSASIAPAANAVIGGVTSFFWRGSMKGLRVWSMIPSATEIGYLANGSNVPYRYVGAGNTATYSSNWSAGVDGWAAVNGVASGNNDAVSDGSASRDDCYKFYADATNSNHFTSKSVAGLYKAHRIDFEYYIPAGQTNVTKFGIQTRSGVVVSHTTVGAWTVGKFFEEENNNSAISCYAYPTAGVTYVGANDANDDRFFLSYIKKYHVGCTMELDFTESSPTIAYDRSGNGHNATISGAVLFNETKKLGQLTIAGSNASTTKIDTMKTAGDVVRWLKITTGGSVFWCPADTSIVK